MEREQNCYRVPWRTRKHPDWEEERCPEGPDRQKAALAQQGGSWVVFSPGYRCPQVARVILVVCGSKMASPEVPQDCYGAQGIRAGSRNVSREPERQKKDWGHND